METINLYITRDNSILGSILPFIITINGKKAGTLRSAMTKYYRIPNTYSTLKISMIESPLTLYKTKKEIVLHPQYCKTGCINCMVMTKLNLLGFLSFGLLEANTKLELIVDYH